MLKPNYTYEMNGVTVNEKIIPDGTRWKDGSKAAKAGFSPGALYKKQKKLSGGSGKAQKVTVHTTNDLASVYDDAEQYARATYNENMKSALVHFYVDDTGAWQILKAGTGLCSNDPDGGAETSRHSGDKSVADGGNMTSISIEIIMGEGAEHDAIARDNGARVAAWNLYKHRLSIDDLVTHTYWVNKSAGKKFADVDEQCTNLIKGKKWCPSYIFGSENHAIALANWKAFKALVKKYLDALNDNAEPEQAKPAVPAAPAADTFTKKDIGIKVKCKPGVTKFSNGAKMLPFVPKATLYIRAVEQGGKILLVSTEKTKKAYTGRVNASDMVKI